MNTEKQFQLQRFQEISQQMLVLAESNDWEQLPELEIEREKLMLCFFEEPSAAQDFVLAELSPQDSMQVEQAINHVLSINDKITSLAEKEKVSIGSQMRGLKKRQNVHSAYMQNK